MSVITRGTIKEKLQMSFQTFDIDNNGYIEESEMCELLEAIYDLLGQKDRTGENDPALRVKNIMKTLDTNGDGVLSAEEFQNGCEHDGCLSNLLAPTTYQVKF